MSEQNEPKIAKQELNPKEKAAEILREVRIKRNELGTLLLRAEDLIKDESKYRTKTSLGAAEVNVSEVLRIKRQAIIDEISEFQDKFDQYSKGLKE